MIDRATVQKIIDAADIVEVVSDFVNLKRRGSNYIGLCPFHNEKTPSFSVSKSKGICKCFSCGKGGSAVNFIMEHEQLSYYEALKYLAKKYHIEVKERELTNEEKEAQSERENMLLINEFALNHFEDNLFNTQEGKDIGMSYFVERGFSEISIKKFHLGYSLDRNDDLYTSAMKEGLNEKVLFNTGLCMEGRHGGGFDRFKGRVMFPVFNIAGKVIAFGGRTLKNDPAKYVNSPESLIYKKSNELYGLFQAKQSIVKKEKCFLVEGYADVISFHQSGIENVVASSGTSLTEGQIRMIHRFTDNVTVLYDGDSAGIKASLRGIDMLLAEGLNIKVLLLPDGEDPDSFAQSHSATELQEYIDKNETDFIKFKTRILLEGAENDPIKRSAVIQDIVRSISVIPFPITQNIYTKECSRLLDIDEKILTLEIGKAILKNKEKEFKDAEKEKREEIKNEYPDTIVPQQNNGIKRYHNKSIEILQPFEKEIIRFIIKYGMTSFCMSTDSSEQKEDITLLEYITGEMALDNMRFSVPIYEETHKICTSLCPQFKSDLQKKIDEFSQFKEAELQKGFAELRERITDIKNIEAEEQKIGNDLDSQISKEMLEFRQNYIEKILCSHPNNDIRHLASDMTSNKYHLSKIHTKYTRIPTEYSKLTTLIPNAINNWKNCIVTCNILKIREDLNNEKDTNRIEELLKQLQTLYNMKATLSPLLGERVVNPKH